MTKAGISRGAEPAEHDDDVRAAEPEARDNDGRASVAIDFHVARGRWLVAMARVCDPENDCDDGSDFEVEYEAALVFAAAPVRFKSQIFEKLAALEHYVCDTIFAGKMSKPIEPFFISGIKADLYRLCVSHEDIA